jgi:signal transduction histidine kinase
VSTQEQAAPLARPPTQRRPPLGKRLRPGHWLALDILAAVPSTLVIMLSVLRIVFQSPAPWRTWEQIVASLALALMLSGPMALRRRGPLIALVWGVSSAVAVTAVAYVGPGGVGIGELLRIAPAFLLPSAYVIYLVAAQYQRRTAVTALAAVLGLVVLEGVALVIGPGVAPGEALFTGLVVVIFWMVGYGAHQRRVYAAQLQEQAASSAVTEERLRIARELHDVVAHGMTVVAVQAGYGLHVIEDQPVKAQEALTAIQATSREALADMRRMLGVLRRGSVSPFGIRNGVNSQRHFDQQPDGGSSVKDSGGTTGAAGGIGGLRFRAASVGDAPVGGAAVSEAAPLAPAPRLADLDRLTARVGNAGVQVDLRIVGEPRELPPGIDLTAFRIVQEALTNVVKHAEVAACRVTVSYQPDELSVEIIDEGRGGQVPAVAGGHGAGLGGDGGGHGLIGMRERVSMYGGKLIAAPRPERGFRVAARLPIAGEPR